MASIALDLDGYTDLPPGHIANVVTYLQMLQPNAEATRPAPLFLSVRRVEQPDIESYRSLYRRIGNDWLWFSRLVMPEAELGALLAQPDTEIYFLERDGEPVGLVELHRNEPDAGEVEIAMFGVVPEATGTGAGRFMMESVLAEAWQGGTRRVWLHTCSFDHPAAIRFYQKAGFRPFKFAIEISPDPRVDGFLPRDAAPHVALIDPGAP
jgi:GNAT superfamily N-acetyltransferase